MRNMRASARRIEAPAVIVAFDLVADHSAVTQAHQAVRANILQSVDCARACAKQDDPLFPDFASQGAVFDVR